MSCCSNKRLKTSPEEVLLIFQRMHRQSYRETKISVNEVALRESSPVFEAMLKNDAFLEGRTRQIRLVGMDVSLAWIFNSYLKNGTTMHMILQEEDLYALLKASHLYLITSLLQECEARLYKMLTLNKLFTTLSNIHHYSSVLSQQIIDLIHRAAFLLFENCTDIELLTEHQMHKVLRSEDLVVLNEQQAFEALIKWGKGQCTEDDPTMLNVAEAIQRLVPCIKWTYVTLASNRQWPELSKMLKSYFTKERRTIVSREPGPIDTRSSLIPHSKFLVLSNLNAYDKRIEKIRGRKMKIKDEQLITFTLDFDAYLIGFEAYFIFDQKIVKKYPSLSAFALKESGFRYTLKLVKSENCEETTPYLIRMCTFETSRFIKIEKGAIQALCVSTEGNFSFVFFPKPVQPAKFKRKKADFEDSESNVFTVTRSAIGSVGKIYFIPA